jgi:sugar O-acyltransferase (sialic acid O-acetyltransferase NeuD family)
MKTCYIIGAGGFAKEVLLILKRRGNFIFGGYLCHTPTETSVGGNAVYSIESFLKSTPPSENIEIYMGIGSPLVIEKISKEFKEYNFPNLVSPCVEIDESVTMGVGNIITKGVNLTVDIKIGSFNIFNLNITIGHDSVIGDFNVINPGATVSGSVTLGNCNLIGTGATILQNLTIGENNVIGGNGLLNKSVENDKTMVGVPCKELIKNKT